MAMPGNGTGVEVVSKVNGSDVPEICAVTPTEKSRSMAMLVMIRERYFMVKVFLMRK